MAKKRSALFVAAGLLICGAAFAGPIDNANEFVNVAVEEAEERNNPPMDQSGDNPAISWANDTSGTDSAVNIGSAGASSDADTAIK